MNLLWKKNQFVFHTWTLKEAKKNARVFTIEHLKFNWCSLFSLPEFTIYQLARCIMWSYLKFKYDAFQSEG